MFIVKSSGIFSAADICKYTVNRLCGVVHPDVKLSYSDAQRLVIPSASDSNKTRAKPSQCKPRFHYRAFCSRHAKARQGWRSLLLPHIKLSRPGVRVGRKRGSGGGGRPGPGPQCHSQDPTARPDLKLKPGLEEILRDCSPDFFLSRLLYNSF